MCVQYQFSGGKRAGKESYFRKSPVGGGLAPVDMDGNDRMAAVESFYDNTRRLTAELASVLSR